MQARIEYLEHQLKQQKRINIVVMVVLLLVVATGFTRTLPDVEPVIKANKFELVNGQGKTVLVMEPRETAAEIALYNNEGNLLISLGSEVKSEGAFIQLKNRKGENSMQLRCNQDGAALKMYDDKNNSIVYIGEDKLHDRAGIISLAENDTQKIILNTHEECIYIANPKVKTGYSQLPN